MKSIGRLLIVIISLNLKLAFCDIIPENSHYVNKCVKITNISEYTNLVMLGYVWYVGNYHQDTYEVSSVECLTKGYKFNTLRLFAVNANYIAGKDIDELDLPNDKNALETNLKINPYAGYYLDTNPIDKIEEYYKIIGFTHSNVIIYKYMDVYGFNNGSPDSINTYEYTEDISSLFQSILTGIIRNKELFSEINLFPNPTEKYLNAHLHNSYLGNVGIKLYSSEGKLLFSEMILKNAEEDFTSISFENYKPGVYFISFKFGDAIETKRFVIE